jgi:hypothetical protein
MTGTTMRRTARGAAVVGGSLAAAAVTGAATYRYWRNWCLSWGATAEEAAASLPGDELLGRPDILSTRAIWVAAPPEDVWPWLVQIGPGRGGAYTYDWIENLFGLGMHSADRILPQFQDLSVGDAQQLGKRGPVLRVARLDRPRALVFRSDDGNWVWAFILVAERGGTRLVSRNRIALPGSSGPARALSTYVMEPGSLIMERKMLLGIRQRAERPEHPQAGAIAEA